MITDYNPFTCPYCGAKRRTPRGLREHQDRCEADAYEKDHLEEVRLRSALKSLVEFDPRTTVRKK